MRAPLLRSSGTSQQDAARNAVSEQTRRRTLRPVRLPAHYVEPMRRAPLALVLLAASAVAGCGGSAEEAEDAAVSARERYSAEVRENFLDSCLENATSTASGRVDEGQLTRTCECILGKVEAEYSEDEFTQLEQRLLAGTASDAEDAQLSTWSQDCAREASR